MIKKYVIKQGDMLCTADGCYVIINYHDGYAYGYEVEYDAGCDDFIAAYPEDAPLRYTKNDIRDMVRQDTGIDYNMIYFGNYNNLIGGH